MSHRLDPQVSTAAIEPKFFFDSNREQPIDIVMIDDAIGIKVGQMTFILRPLAAKGMAAIPKKPGKSKT